MPAFDICLFRLDRDHGGADVARGEAVVGHQTGVQDRHRRAVAGNEVGACEVGPEVAERGRHHQHRAAPGAVQDTDRHRHRQRDQDPDPRVGEEGHHLGYPGQARGAPLGDPTRHVVVPPSD